MSYSKQSITEDLSLIFDDSIDNRGRLYDVGEQIAWHLNHGADPQQCGIAFNIDTDKYGDEVVSDMIFISDSKTLSAYDEMGFMIMSIDILLGEGS